MPWSDPVHRLKYLLTLTVNDYTDLLTDLSQFVRNISKRFGGIVHVDHHHHVKIPADYGLGNIKYVDPVVVCAPTVRDNSVMMTNKMVFLML